MRTTVLIHLVWVATAVEALRCGQGSLYPDVNGNLPSGTVWNTQVCLQEDTSCLTMYTHDSQNSKLITGRCTPSCQESTLTYSDQDWVVTTCCNTDNCNSNLSDFSTFDWTTPRIGDILPRATFPPLNTTFSCRQGIVAPMTDGRIQTIDNTTMMFDVTPCGDAAAQYCMTSYARSATNDRQIVASCANTCQNTTIAQAANNWLVITCCDTSNCNADLTTIASFDWNVARITTTTAVPIVSSTGVGSFLPTLGDSTVFGSFTLMPTQPPDAIQGNTSTSTGVGIQNGVDLIIITPSIVTLILAFIGMIVLL